MVELKDQRFSVLDLLLKFNSIEAHWGDIIQTLNRVVPRQYTIASSNKMSESKVRLAVSLSSKGEWMGHTSEYLQNLKPGDNIRISVDSSSFNLPEGKPVIMVGPGTGVAPFIAFCEEREKLGLKSHASLYFGCRRHDSDYIFRE